MNKQYTTYSDAIDELDVKEIDDTISETSNNQPNANKLLKNTDQSASRAISEWQRQAIINSVNVYPFFNQAQSFINQCTQQMVDNSTKNIQSQIDNFNCQMSHSLSHSQGAVVYNDLESIRRMIDEVKRECNYYVKYNSIYDCYSHDKKSR